MLLRVRPDQVNRRTRSRHARPAPAPRPRPGRTGRRTGARSRRPPRWRAVRRWRCRTPRPTWSRRPAGRPARLGPKNWVAKCAVGASRVSSSWLTAPESWRTSTYVVSCRPVTAVTSPGRSRTPAAPGARACGPRSHSPPFARRQADPPYGLPGWKIDPYMAKRGAVPLRRRERRNAATPGWKRAVEEDDRGDAGPVRRRDDRVGVGHGERQRLVQQQVPAGGGGAGGDAGLDVGRQRDRDQVHVGDESVGVGVRAGPQARRRGRSPGPGSRPHTPTSSTPGCRASAAPWVARAQCPVPKRPHLT
jgi:hypothetical protein